MLLLILFAFLAGIVTILSPCILPMLPIILSGSIKGGKQRPFGIVTGFIASFTIFTVILSSLVQATGISNQSLRTFSVIVIAVFGASLLIPQVQKLLEKLFSYLSNFIPNNSKSTGFGGGLLLGISLGLLWTPCVGPILASVISLALTGSISGTLFLITFAYSLGTAIPMFIIIYTGRKIFEKVPWLLSRSQLIQKIFGVIMILTAIAIYFNFDKKFQTYIITVFPQYGAGLTAIEDSTLIDSQLQKVFNLEERADDTTTEGELFSVDEPYPAPEIIPGGEWFNSQPVSLEELRGKVVLVDFWTYSCINCIRTIPYLKDWYSKYKDAGFVILGVHRPEFQFEYDVDNVDQAITDYGIEYPVVQDNNAETWRAYNNRYWPAHYFVDANGRVRHVHYGEGEYDQSEMVIQELLKEAGSTVSQDLSSNEYNPNRNLTPETYLGAARMARFASPEKYQVDKSTTFSTPRQIGTNYFAYEGNWTITPEYSVNNDQAKLTLEFSAQDVFLVMRSTDEPAQVTVLLDGKPVTLQDAGSDVQDSRVVVNEDRLYTLINLDELEQHRLTLEFPPQAIEIFAFTFG